MASAAARDEPLRPCWGVPWVPTPTGGRVVRGARLAPVSPTRPMPVYINGERRGSSLQSTLVSPTFSGYGWPGEKEKPWQEEEDSGTNDIAPSVRHPSLLLEYFLSMQALAGSCRTPRLQSAFA